MATLADLWNYPNNASNGYMTNSANWSGDDSYGADKRIKDFLNGTYKAWPGLTPADGVLGSGLSSTTGSAIMGKYADHYLNSFGDDANLTFRQMYSHEMTEWYAYINGAKVTAVVTEVDTGGAGEPAIKMTTDSTTPHKLSNGDAISGFAFSNAIADDSYFERLNYDKYYVRVVDANNVFIYEDSGLTTPAYFGTSEGTAKAEHLPTMYSVFPHNDGSYNGALIAFPNAGFPGTTQASGATQVTKPQTSLTAQITDGTEFKIAAQHTGSGTTASPSPGGTFGSATAGTSVYLKHFRDNVYKAYTDSAMTTPYTVTSVAHSTIYNSGALTISASTTYATLAGTISDTGTQDFIKASALLTDNSSSSIYQGMCRCRIVQGTSTSSTKTIPTTLDDSEYFHYSYNDVTKAFLVYEDLYNEANRHYDSGTSAITTGAWGGYNLHGYSDNLGTATLNAAKQAELQESSSTNQYEFQVEFHSIFEVSNVDGQTAGGQLFRDNVSQTLTVGSQGISGSSSLSNPIIGKYNDLFTHTYTTPSNHPSPGTTEVVVTSTSSTWPELKDLYLGVGRTVASTYWFGTQKYKYQDSSNVTQVGAGTIDFNNRYVPTGYIGTNLTNKIDPGLRTNAWTISLPQKSSSGDTNYYREQSRVPSITPGVDSVGQLNNTLTVTDTGVMDWTSFWGGLDEDEMSDVAIINVINDPYDTFWVFGASHYRYRADDYVAPTPYAEDVWDTDSEWDSESSNSSKLWPKHITPRSISVIQATPSSTTTSQNGIKYVRATGIVRHQLEVEYPPMTETDFREFEATVAAARGQATPFYFDFKGYGNAGNQAIAFNRIDANKTASGPFPLKEASALGNKYLLLEGFDADATEVVLKGEFMILNGSADGNLIQAVSTTDSNVFGEAKFRMAVGLRSAAEVRTDVYKNPQHAIVTLAEDTLEYSIGTDQLYRFSVRFDFDEWK